MVTQLIIVSFRLFLDRTSTYQLFELYFSGGRFSHFQKGVPTKDKRGFPFLRTPTPHPTPHGPTLFFTSKNFKVNCSYYNKYALNFLTFSMNVIIFLLSSSIVLTGESNYKNKTFYMCKTYTGERSSNKQNSRCFTCCEEKSYHSWKGIGLP